MELKELTAKFINIFGNFDEFSIEKLTDESCLQYVNLVEGDLGTDYLQKIWQFYKADRKDKKQDFTPKSLAALVSRLTQNEKEEWVYDVCSGSGSLSIQKWILNKKAKFVCEELDSFLIPFLLFNLRVRNIEGYVINGNVLTGERFAVYKLKKGRQFSEIEKTKDFSYPEFQTGLSNPPFNLKGESTQSKELFKQEKEIYSPVDLKNMNFVFVFRLLERVKGKSAVILPAGVLTSEIEKKAREHLIQNKKIFSVVLNPTSMFESTGVGTVVLTFGEDEKDISFVNGVKNFTQEERKQNGEEHTRNRIYTKTFNIYSDENIKKIVKAVNKKESIEDEAETVLYADVKAADLRPSSYIKRKEPEIKHRPFDEIIKDLIHIQRRKNSCKLRINETWAKEYKLCNFYELIQEGNNKTEDINKMIKNVLKLDLQVPKDDYFMLSKSKVWVLENNDKEYVSQIVLGAVNAWRVMVHFLNEESARLLIELRDALLPELMSGRIDINDIDID